MQASRHHDGMNRKGEKSRSKRLVFFLFFFTIFTKSLFLPCLGFFSFLHTLAWHFVIILLNSSELSHESYVMMIVITTPNLICSFSSSIYLHIEHFVIIKMLTLTNERHLIFFDKHFSSLLQSNQLGKVHMNMQILNLSLTSHICTQFDM